MARLAAPRLPGARLCLRFGAVPARLWHALALPLFHAALHCASAYHGLSCWPFHDAGGHGTVLAGLWSRVAPCAALPDCRLSKCRQPTAARRLRRRAAVPSERGCPLIAKQSPPENRNSDLETGAYSLAHAARHSRRPSRRPPVTAAGTATAQSVPATVLAAVQHRGAGGARRASACGTWACTKNEILGINRNYLPGSRIKSAICPRKLFRLFARGVARRRPIGNRLTIC